VAIRSNRSIASVDSIVAEHLTGVGQSVAFVNALHHKNAAQRPIACQCFLQGLTVAPSPRLQPSHPMLRFMHGSGMWLVLTKARGPARVLFPAPLSACDRSSSTVSQYGVVPLLKGEHPFLWRRLGQRQSTANALSTMVYGA
jgi:hypothetical protein